MKNGWFISALTCLALAALVRPARSGVTNCRVGTDGLAVVPSPRSTRPVYLDEFAEPTYGGEVVRITAPFGMALSSAQPNVDWQTITRHHFAKDQPWSADGALLAIENKNGTPPWLYLDGDTYKLLAITNTPGITYADWRWHPTLADVQIVVDDYARTLYWTNVRTHEKLWAFDFSQQLPAFGHSDGIGSYEGNPSDDGRVIALSDAATRSGSGQPVHVMIVEMRTTPPVFAVSTLPDPGLFRHSGKIGWVSVSPDARELVVKYGADSTARSGEDDECIRVFDLDTDPTSHAYLRVIHPHAFGGSAGAPAYIGCGRATGGLDSTGVPLRPLAGWVYPLKHPDMMMDGSIPILVGVNGCGSIGDESDRLGRILRVDLLTGAVSRLSTKDPVAGKGPGRNKPTYYRHEPPAMHVSCRNSARPGWVYVTYDAGAGKRFGDEIVAVRIDSSGAVERFAHTHSAPDSLEPGPKRAWFHLTDAEPQAVPSRDGGRVLWASNWKRDCDGDCGSMMEVKDYVVDARCDRHRIDRLPAVTEGGGATPIDVASSLTSLPNPFRHGTTIQFELRTSSMVRLEIFDAQGRRVAQVANSFYPAGRHTLAWDRLGASGEVVRPGVYLCRLTAGPLSDQTQLVLLP